MCAVRSFADQDQVAVANVLQQWLVITAGQDRTCDLSDLFCVFHHGLLLTFEAFYLRGWDYRRELKELLSPRNTRNIRKGEPASVSLSLLVCFVGSFFVWLFFAAAR